MSNLPHPLGDSNPGDLFYPGTPTVIVTDLPGAGGSRAVEFGEDGTSAAVNRGLYALAKNDEYIQARMEQDVARPELVTFTPAGGNGDSYTFTADVWCGDTDYTPEDQSVRNGLMSVMDERYNDLIDPTTGDVIVVKEILDAPAGSSQVGAGFVTNPYITFRRMQPVTGALGADYTIPDGTKVWLAYGQKSQWDQLVGGSSGKLQDALFRGFTRSIGEIHAASFLHDGSRKATGNFFMDGHDFFQVRTVFGEDGTPLSLWSINDKVRLHSDDIIDFQDQYTSGFVTLNDGDTGVEGFYNSMLTSLNSKTLASENSVGNRVLDRTGSFTLTGATGQIDWPEIKVVIDGETRTVAAGNILVTNDPTTERTLVVDTVGTVVERAEGWVRIGDIPLYAYTWNGSAFTFARDIRWRMDKADRLGEITVGDTNAAAFGPTELDEAVALACALSKSNPDFKHRPTIRVYGLVTASKGVTIPITAPIEFVGSGPESSILRADTTSGSTIDMFDCGGNKVVFRDVGVWLYSGTQAAPLCAIKNAGSRSVFENVQFIGEFANAYLWDSAADHVHIKDNKCETIQNAFVNGSDATFDTPYLTYSLIENCDLGWGASALYGIIANGSGNTIRNVKVGTGLDTYGFVVGNTCLVDGCCLTFATSASAFYYHPVVFPDFNQKTTIRDCAVYNCGTGFKSAAVNDSGVVVEVNIVDSTFENMDWGIDFGPVLSTHFYSRQVVRGCRFTEIFYGLATFANVYFAEFRDNCAYDCGGDGIYVMDGTACDIFDNNLEGFGPNNSGVLARLIHVDYDSYGARIMNNWLGSYGAPSSGLQMQIEQKSTISGNTCFGSYTVSGMFVSAWSSTDAAGAQHSIISNNDFRGYGSETINIGSEGTGTYKYSGCVVQGNTFRDTIESVSTAVVVDNVTDVQIDENMFDNLRGQAVEISGFAQGGKNCTVKNNKFTGVQMRWVGTTVRGVVAVRASSGGCRGTVINGNHFSDCGYENPGTAQQSIIYMYATDYSEVSDNHIHGLTGSSSTTDYSDISSGIRMEVSCDFCLVKGNYILKDFSDTGKVASIFWGIAADSESSSIVGNFIKFYGTQTDANKTSELYGLWTVGTDAMLVATNYVETSCVISGITSFKSYYCANDWSCIVGNFGDGADMDFQALNVVVVGNYMDTVGTLLYTNSITNNPETSTFYSATNKIPMADVNQL